MEKNLFSLSGSKHQKKCSLFSLSLWYSLNFTTWLQLLYDNSFRFARDRIPLAIAATCITFSNSLLGFLESLIYSRKVASTEIKEHPIFIIGHWRSGTTLLHDLLGLDERHTYPTNYQCFCPGHFLLTERFLKPVLKLFAPSKRPQDNVPFAFDRPQEDEFALSALGISHTYLNVAFPADFKLVMKDFNLDLLPPGKLKQWENTFLHFLKQVTFANPKRLVLKSPPHTFRIKELLRLFPNARFIHIVRNPYIVFQSSLKLWRSFSQVYALQDSDFDDIENNVFELFIHMYEKLEKTQRFIPSSQFHELRYEDLVSDPEQEIKKLYHETGLTDFEKVLPAIKNYLRETSRYKTNTYNLSPELKSEITIRLGKIIEKYGYSVPS